MQASTTARDVALGWCAVYVGVVQLPVSEQACTLKAVLACVLVLSIAHST
jgi:hypothetical protein